jgi:hypothetical protein
MVESYDDLDWARVVHPGKDLRSYSVSVPWNHMTVKDWEVAAVDACDSNWRVTKDTAWNSAHPEAIKFVYCDGSLVAVLYCLATRGNCGCSYKGHGMTHAERMLVEQFFVEIDDEEEGPYVYKRRTSLPT